MIVLLPMVLSAYWKKGGVANQPPFLTFLNHRPQFWNQCRAIDIMPANCILELWNSKVGGMWFVCKLQGYIPILCGWCFPHLRTRFDVSSDLEIEPPSISLHISMSRVNLCCLQSFWIWPLCGLVTLDAFKLLDVGAPRTGTQSFYDAMKILNLNPVHSGYQSEVRPALCEYLFRNGSLDDALGVLDGYDAAMDEPFMLMYEEIMAAFPEAKFVLTISDAESWFDNYVEMERFLATYHSQALHEKYGALPPECKASTFWGCWFLNSTQEDKDLDCWRLCFIFPLKISPVWKSAGIGNRFCLLRSPFSQIQ